jgi:hypothetical protein
MHYLHGRHDGADEHAEEEANKLTSGIANAER